MLKVQDPLLILFWVEQIWQPFLRRKVEERSSNISGCVPLAEYLGLRLYEQQTPASLFALWVFTVMSRVLPGRRIEFDFAPCRREPANCLYVEELSRSPSSMCT